MSLFNSFTLSFVLTRGVIIQSRNQNLELFAKGRTTDNDNVDYVLICTDRAARGVDFDSAPVDHVIIFDFPKDPAEYVRRVGRTARAGRAGASTVFAYGWQLPVARKVMGSKLDSFTIAANEDDSDDYESRRIQKKGRNKKRKNASMKEIIESGELWD